MTCREFSNSLMAFVSGELAEEEHHRAERHAQRCPCCAAEVDSYLRIIRLARLLPQLDPPPELLDRLRAALKLQKDVSHRNGTTH
jgi:anti-sigma factor RsiW